MQNLKRGALLFGDTLDQCRLIESFRDLKVEDITALLFPVPPGETVQRQARLMCTFRSEVIRVYPVVYGMLLSSVKVDRAECLVAPIPASFFSVDQDARVDLPTCSPQQIISLTFYNVTTVAVQIACWIEGIYESF